MGRNRRHGQARGEILEGRVRDLTEGGDAVVETTRGLVLVRGPLPAERVRVRCGPRQRGVLRGQLEALLERSPERREPACPHASECGGCPLMGLSMPAQRAHKLGQVQRAVGDVTVAANPDDEELAYRRRARLGWNRSRSGLRIGYRAAASHRLVEVSSCAVLAPPLAAGLEALRALPLQGDGRIDLVLGAGGLAAALLSATESQPEALYRALEACVEAGALSGVALSVGDGGAPATFGDPTQHVQGADGEPLSCALDGFAQVHPGVNRKLVALVHELAQPAGADVLELYAGHGNLSVCLAAEAAQFVAVESDPAAAEACRQNLARRGGDNARVVVKSAVEAAAAGGRVDVVVLDPPRSGARGVVEAVAARRPERIVYVSCAMGTLRRDLGSLRGLGYVVDRAHALDMFPQTGRVEAVVRLVPAVSPG